ncbi:MAG: DNA adenine methylase [Pirellulaceae bacterium]
MPSEEFPHAFRGVAKLLGQPALQQTFDFLESIETTVAGTRERIETAFTRLRPPVKAHGGKYYLARQIVPILLKVRAKVTEYLEPCAFGASVFLALPRVQREILGDINPAVTDLWKVLGDPGLAATLSKRLSAVTYDQTTFDAAGNERGGDIVDRTIRFLIRSRFSRGGLGKSFAWSERTRGGRPGDENAWHTFRENELPRIIERARGVEVTSAPCWSTVWESRQKIQHLIYADPPYMPRTRTAKQANGPFEMTPLQHFWLVGALRAHSGPVAISGYRCGEYDRWLHDWRRYDFDMPNNSGQTRKKQRRTESLWVNW